MTQAPIAKIQMPPQTGPANKIPLARSAVIFSSASLSDPHSSFVLKTFFTIHPPGSTTQPPGAPP